MWDMYLMHPDELFRNVQRCGPAVDCDAQRHLLLLHGIEPWLRAPHRIGKLTEVQLGQPLQSLAHSVKNQALPPRLDS